MNRADLQALATRRLRDAEILLLNSRYDAAYYVAGYSVECALKACIARMTKESDFPDKARTDKAWTHSLEKLIDAAELKPTLSLAREQSADFDQNWAIVKDWSEHSRYDLRDRTQAEALVEAISDARTECWNG